MPILITFPRFIREEIRDNFKCVMCDFKFSERHIIYMGVGENKHGIWCFTYEASCPHCKYLTTEHDDTHAFQTPNWWGEIAQWHEQAVTRLGPFESFPSPDAIPQLLLGPEPILSVNVLGGYKGDVGPVLLRLGIKANGNLSVAVRLEPNNRFRFLLTPDDENISITEWEKLAKLPELHEFEHGGKHWWKLTRHELFDILGERVFEGIPVERVTTQTTKKRKRHENSDAPKGRKGNRRSPRHTG